MRRGYGFLIPAAGIIIAIIVPSPAIAGPVNLASSYTINAGRAYCVVTSTLPGDFINEQGEYLGNDGKNDGKLYVIKTSKNQFESFGDVKAAGISDSVAKTVEAFVRRNSGDAAAFDGNKEVYEAVQEMEMSVMVRQKMLDIVCKDNGRGDTLAVNNREYGGTVDKHNNVLESMPGIICDPSSGAGAGIDIRTGDQTKYEFHSHPSGARSILASDRKTITWCYHQAVSETDIERVGNLMGYVFGQRDQVVYIYNKKGILATIPVKYFVRPDLSGTTLAHR